MKGKFFYIAIVGIILLIVVLFNHHKAVSTLQDEHIVDENIVNANTFITGEVPTKFNLENANGKRFNVPISALPELENYLDTSMDMKTELERVQVDYLDWNLANDHYFILKYGCGNKICDLVLIQIMDNDDVNTKYLANGIFIDSKVFEEKAMLRIAVNEGNTVVRHQMILVDLHSMDTLHSTDKSVDEYYFTSPLYPIQEFQWITAETVELVVADISDTTYETIEEWTKATNQPVKSIKIKIE